MPPSGHLQDTSADAAAMLVRSVRALSAPERLRKGWALSQRGKRLALAAIRRRHPAADEAEIRLRYLALAYGPTLAADVRRWLEDRRQ